jgi:hypothetical protein
MQSQNKVSSRANFFRAQVIAVLNETLRTKQISNICRIVFPSLILFLGSIEGLNDSESIHNCLDLVFYIFSISADDASRNTILSYILPPVLAVLQIAQKENSNFFSTFCGEAFANLAQNHPLLFKTHVASISAEERILLQTVIKAALQNNQGVSRNHQSVHTLSTSTASGGSDAHSSFKKIDMSKYKK